jgi:hypothetical protein
MLYTFKGYYFFSMFVMARRAVDSTFLSVYYKPKLLSWLLLYSYFISQSNPDASGAVPQVSKNIRIRIIAQPRTQDELAEGNFAIHNVVH